MRRALNDLMEFDHPVRVNADGSVTDGPEYLYAPDVYNSMSYGVEIHGEWEPLTGYSGQCGYSGPLMHPSEYIGGRMERDILAEPGVYVAVVVPDLDGNPPDSDSWMVLRYTGDIR